MADEKFLKYSRVLKVVYVYEEQSDELSLYKDTFKSVEQIPYGDFLASSEKLDADIVFVNFSSKDLKSLFLRLSQLSSYIVVYTPYESNPAFLKNALKFKIDLVTKKMQNNDTLSQLFQTIVKNLSANYKDKTAQKRNETILNAEIHAFLYIVDKEVVYITKKAQEIFNVSSTTEFNEKYITDGSQIQLIEMMHSSDKQQYIQIKNLPKEPTFLAISKKTDTATILSLTPIENLPSESSQSSLINRVKFIEELKNQIIQKDKMQVCSVNLVFINITNMKAIIKEFGSYNSFIFSNEFANYIKNTLDENALITTWTQEGFVFLSESVMYDKLREKVQEVTQKLHLEVFQNNIVPFAKSGIIEANSDNLNEIITIIDTFFNARVDLTLAKKYDYHEFNQALNQTQGNDGLIEYFSNIMYAQTPLRLLNIYKGVNITTTAFVEKINDNNIIVKAKNIQLYTMQLEKQTVIQCPSLPKDVEVYVDIVDLKKNIAVFSNPKLLEFSANNRETTRVQSDFRFPVKMKQEKVVHSGEILDLSMRSIAIKFPQTIQTQFKQGKVFVSFRVPVETHDEGFFQTQIEGNLIRFDPIDEKFCKGIILLQMQEPEEGYVLEYIYKRQKEIIFEIKKLALKGLANGL